MAGKDTRPETFQVGEDVQKIDYSDEDIVTVTDRSGNSIQYRLFEGVHYSPYLNMNLIKRVRSFKMRPDDICFPGYPRSGTHWTFEMASMLLNGKAETIQRFKDHLEFKSQDDFEKLPSPRIIHCHMKLSDCPDDVRLKKLKVIYTLRDPKDVAVSMYNAYYGKNYPLGTYMGTFEDYLPLFLTGKVDNNGIMEHLRDADKFFQDNPDIPVHFQKYEDTIKDPVLGVQKLSDFLGLPRNDDLCRSIAEKCEFSRMKADKDKYALKVDDENYLYRKGTVGDWRNYFTDALLEDYYRVYDEMLGGTRFYSLYAQDKL